MKPGLALSLRDRANPLFPAVFFLRFIHQFPGHMLRNKRKHKRPRSGMTDLVFNILFISGELVRAVSKITWTS